MGDNEMNEVMRSLGRIESDGAHTKERVEEVYSEVKNVREELEYHIRHDESPGVWATKKFLLILAFFFTVITPILIDRAFDWFEHRDYARIWVPKEELYKYYMLPTGGGDRDPSRPDSPMP